MKINNLLLITGILSAFYAISLIFIPEMFLELHGAKTDAYGIFLGRMVGGLAVGYALLGIFASKLQNNDALRAAAIANCGGWAASAIIIFIAKSSLQFSIFIWFDLIFTLVFSIAFGVYIVKKQNA